ncbi:MAG: glycosyltransferase family 4 protein [Fimbriimonadales bacterium]
MMSVKQPKGQAKRVNRCVLLISPYSETIVSFRGALISDLIREGATVYVLAPDYTPPIRDAVERLGAIPLDYSLDRTGRTPLQDLRTLWELWRILRRLRPDIILPYNIKPVIYGTLAGKLVGVPKRIALIPGLGYAFMKQNSLQHRILTWAVCRLYRLSLRYAHQVIFFNLTDLNEFLSLRLVSPQQALLLNGTGVNLAEWSVAPPATTPPTFTLAARLLREKGVVEFAEAARRIKARYPTARFWLLGGLDTNPGALTRAEVEAWVKEGILEWFGRVEDVRPYFAQTSVYVLPSYYREGVPRSTQEALAMGRPVITTDAPGCRETVVEGVNGFMVPPRDVEALVRAMERFIREPELIVTMGCASRKLAEERFDVNQINREFLRVMGFDEHQEHPNDSSRL